MENKRSAKPKGGKKENTHKNPFTYLLGGNIFAAPFFRRQTGLIILISIYTFLYIANRYASQQEIREIEYLKAKLTDTQYEALSRISILSEKSRQSYVEEYVMQQDSGLQIANKPPYIIK